MLAPYIERHNLVAARVCVCVCVTVCEGAENVMFRVFRWL